MAVVSAVAASSARYTTTIDLLLNWFMRIADPLILVKYTSSFLYNSESFKLHAIIRFRKLVELSCVVDQHSTFGSPYIAPPPN